MSLKFRYSVMWNRFHIVNSHVQYNETHNWKHNTKGHRIEYYYTERNKVMLQSTENII